MSLQRSPLSTNLYTMKSLIFLALFGAAYLSPSLASPPNKDRLIRDTWYTMTLNNKIRFGYYNERVELKQGRLFFQSHVWKKEEDFINEEQLGAFSEDNSQLTPLFFNFHSTYRTTELNIDGTLQDGKMLQVKVRKGSQELPVVRRSVGPNTIFAQFFPLWLAKKLPELKNGKNPSFYAIIEDNPELNFAPVSGRARLEKPDKTAIETKTQKLSVVFQDLPSTWWVDDTGVAVRIEMSGGGTVAEKSTKEKALQFLK